MRIISRRTLREFVGKRTGHKDVTSLKHALDVWFHEVQRAKWKRTAEVKRRYASASIVASERIVFNIKPIRTNADYEVALTEIERLWGAKKGTPNMIALTYLQH